MLSCEFLKFSIFCFNSSTVIGFVFRESRAAPLATNKWASSGTITSSGVKFSVSINLFLNSGK